MEKRSGSVFDPSAEKKMLVEGLNSFDTAEVFVRQDQKFHTVPVTGSGRPQVSSPVAAGWQRSLDLLLGMTGASAGYVIRITDRSAVSFLHSGDEIAEYAVGARFSFGTGSFCENVVGLNRFLLSSSELWKQSPFSACAASFAQYCGIPLRWDDGSFFGALCLLSRSGTLQEASVRPLVEEACATIEKDLAILSLRQSRDDSYEQYAKSMEAILQYSPGGIFSYSAEEDEQFSYLSENMLSLLGYTKEEFLKKFENRFSQMVYKEDRRRVLEEVNEQIRRGPFDRCEYRIERKDGSLIWVHDEGHIVTDADGKRWFYVVIVDITATVEAQQQERKKFRGAMQSLLAANPQAVGSLQLNLTANLCHSGHGLSPATNKIFHAKTVDAFFGGVASRMIDPAARQQFLSVFNRAALINDFQAGAASRSVEYLRENEGAPPIWIRLYLNLLANPDTGDVEGVAYSVDISREKRREEILNIITSQEYDLIALIHLKDETVEAYFLGETLPAHYRSLLPAPGAVYDLHAFRRRAVEQWIHPDDREAYSLYSDPDHYRPLMDQGQAFQFTLRECPPEYGGAVRYRRFQHFYLGGDRDTILVVESDVTEASLRQLKELEKAKAETDRIRDIMDSITSGISVLHMPDPEHLSIEYVNRQLFRLLGFAPEPNDFSQISPSAERLVASYHQDAFIGVHPDDLARVKETFRLNFSSERFTVENYRTLGAGGKYYWIKEEVRLREITPEGRVFYATYHDVSEEVRLNAELTAQLEAEKQLRREATLASASKTDFLSRMSHDMRTPLNGIIGMTYLAQEQQNPPRTADCLAKIDKSSQFLLGLINDVLDMAKAESNRIELNPEPYPLEEFNDYLDAVILPLCAEKNQHFVLDETHARTDLIPVVDKLRINQIIFNLLSNAVKYTPEGGTITYRITDAPLPSGRIRIEHHISDTGVGMSAEFQKVLFDPFSQEGRDDNSDKRGSGLGLAIVKKLVDLMDGTIFVRSAPHEGTYFHVCLEFPAVTAKAPAPPAQAALAAAGSVILRGRHILLCEDHPLNQEIAQTLLEQQGALVEIAENGRLGLEKFAASPLGFYDAILMDLRMPVMDGYQATRKIRALSRADAAAIPILAMTADAFSGDVQKCLDAGMNGHLPKPIDPQKLYEALQRAIAARPVTP
ncbi:PAS domain-containing hybrid sensor histidine kinase/response regulator [Acidaminobacterium chupaoyuni]